MWIRDGRCIHLFAFAQRQEDEIRENPLTWHKHEPLFCAEDVKPLQMKMIVHDQKYDESPAAQKERKADRDPPRGERILWKIGRFYGEKMLDDKKFFLLMRLQRFWNNERTLNVLIPMVTRQTQTTPCLLDYLCVNHSKNPEIVYQWNIRGNDHFVNIFKRYNEALKSWHRGCFDPHRRVDPKKPDRIWFDLNVNGNIVTHSTTVAQLNFFHWCWTYGILHYAEEHHADIKMDHMRAQQSRKRRRLENTNVDEHGKKKQKREEIKPASKNPCQTYVCSTLINAFEDSDSDNDIISDNE